MRSRNSQLRQLYSLTLAATLGLGVVLAIPTASFAGGCDGLNLFSGVERDKQLVCRLDFGGNVCDRSLSLPHQQEKNEVCRE